MTLSGFPILCTDVLTYAEEMPDALNREVVVSADHGELLGDRIGPVPMKGHGNHEAVDVDELVRGPPDIPDGS